MNKIVRAIRERIINYVNGIKLNRKSNLIKILHEKDNEILSLERKVSELSTRVISLSGTVMSLELRNKTLQSDLSKSKSEAMKLSLDRHNMIKEMSQAITKIKTLEGLFSLIQIVDLDDIDGLQKLKEDLEKRPKRKVGRK